MWFCGRSNNWLDLDIKCMTWLREQGRWFLLHSAFLRLSSCELTRLFWDRDASQSSDPNMSSAILNAVKRYVACILDNAEGRNEENKPFQVSSMVDGVFVLSRKIFNKLSLVEGLCMQIFMTEIIASSEAPLFLLKGRLLFAVDLLSRAPLLQGDCWLLSLKQFLPWMVTASKQLYHDFMDNSHMQLQLVECFTSFTYCLGRYFLLFSSVFFPFGFRFLVGGCMCRA